MRDPRTALFLAALTMLWIGVPQASARTTTFSATLSGTYRSEGVEVDRTCWRESDSGEVEPFTQRNRSVEEDSFHSLAPITLIVGQLPRQKFFEAGSFEHLATHFTISRTDVREPPLCLASEGSTTQPDCGSLTRTYRLRLYGRVDRPAFSFMFTRGLSAYRPEDPFRECPRFGGLWIGDLETSGPARASPRELFARAPRKLVLHGAASGHPPGESGTANGSFELSWTLTLRRHAGAHASTAPSHPGARGPG